MKEQKPTPASSFSGSRSIFPHKHLTGSRFPRQLDRCIFQSYPLPCRQPSYDEQHLPCLPCLSRQVHQAGTAILPSRFRSNNALPVAGGIVSALISNQCFKRIALNEIRYISGILDDILQTSLISRSFSHKSILYHD